MKKLFLSFSFLLIIAFSYNVFGQPVFEENFDYPVGDSLINHGWTNHSGTGNQISVTASSLTYDGYPSSGIGNSTTVIGGSGSREDSHRDFTEQNAVYASLLVNVANASTTGDYFFHLAPTFPTSTFRGRILIKDNGAGNLQFGVSKGSSTEVVYTTAAYLYNVTYLLVLEYESIGDLGNDDVVRLFINPDLSKLESDTAKVTSVDTTSDILVGSVALRQGTPNYTIQVDGIRIAVSWNTVLPAELISFTASAGNKGVQLKWTTATELNNFGFEIQRTPLIPPFDKGGTQGGWTRVTFIEGNGTTTKPKEYSYTDRPSISGKYLYRLKQVDFNSSYEYSQVVEVNYVISRFELFQNYPNPFNTSTTISFSLPQATDVSLKVFNILGQEVETLVNGFWEEGIHSINYDAESAIGGLNSGIYLYRIEAGYFTQVKTMTLLK